MSIFAYTFKGVANQVLNKLNEVELDTDADFNAATGFHKEIKNNVNLVIEFIASNEDYEWPFLKNLTGSQVLTVGDNTYSVSESHAEVDWDSFYIERDAALDDPDSRKLTQISWDRYKEEFLTRDNNSTTTDEYEKPHFIVRMPDNTFVVTPKPDAAYTLKYNYSGKPAQLENPDDVPVVPSEYRQVILFGVLYYAYLFREDAESADRAYTLFLNGINDMRRVLIPQSSYMKFF